MTYTVFAKLPGEAKYVAQDENGAWGWLMGDGFHKIDGDGSWALKSAVLKYGYKKIDPAQTITFEQMDEVSKTLDAKA